MYQHRRHIYRKQRSNYKNRENRNRTVYCETLYSWSGGCSFSDG